MSIALGSNSMTAAYVGSTSVSKMYLGSDLVFGSEGGGGLPAGYTECDYIMASGGAYIDTGFKAKPTHSIWVDAYVTGIQAQNRFWSARNSLFHVAYINGSSQWAVSYSNSTNWQSTGVAATVGRHTFYLDAVNKIYYVDNGNTASFDLSENTATNTSTSNLFLFKDATNAGATYRGKCLIFGCKIWDGSTLIRNLIPAKQDSTSTYGLYDLANNTFYGSSSSYGFSGRETVTLPDGYTKALYVETVKTGEGEPCILDPYITPSLSFKVTMDFNITNRVKRMFMLAWIGNIADESTKWMADVYIRNSTDLKFAFQYGDSEIWVNTSKDSDLLPHSFEMDSVNEVFKLDDGYLYSTSLSSYSNVSELVDSRFKIMEQINAKCYNAKVWMNGQLVANYIPCRNSDNIYGLYNIVGNYYITTDTQVSSGEDF